MNTIELEAQKAFLAREILCIDDETLISTVNYLLKDYSGSIFKQEQKKREIGFLEGKAKVTFHDDWSMTPEELGMV